MTSVNDSTTIVMQLSHYNKIREALCPSLSTQLRGLAFILTDNSNMLITTRNVEGDSNCHSINKTMILVLPVQELSLLIFKI